MSDKQAGQAPQRKPSTNKNIKKLRTISMVCGLASSWQKWVTDNEEKQASEPSGWAPSSVGGPTEERLKKWVPKKPPPSQIQPTEASQSHVINSEEAKKIFTPHKEIQDASKTEELKTSAKPPVESCIKVKQVVKTVTSGVVEKGAGVGLLTEKIKRESLPSDEEIDRLLKKKSSPTRRRKCSNMVSSLTKSWKQVEKEQKLGKEAGGTGEGRTGGGDKDDRHAEAKKEGLDIEDARTQTTGSLKETEQEESDDDSVSSVKIKRPTVPMWVQVQ